jgi:hypothetical protein
VEVNVSAELATEFERTRPRTRSLRARIVALAGPTTALAGLIWAVAQPYRITLLHPYGQGFWWLVSEPPIYVVVAGLLFHRFVARGLLEDLGEG